MRETTICEDDEAIHALDDFFIVRFLVTSITMGFIVFPKRWEQVIAADRDYL